MTVLVAAPQAGQAQDGTPILRHAPPVGAEARLRKAWRATIRDTRLPQAGCFSAAYPATDWKPVPCAKPTLRPFYPASGAHPPIVGNGDDNTAQTTGTIAFAAGSFDQVSNVTGERDAGANDNYSLQLNSNLFTTAACAGAANPAKCTGWQQFIFSNMPDSINASSSCTNLGGACVFMQYWLLNYGNACPSGWQDAAPHCYRNSDDATSIDRQPIGDLGRLNLTASAGAGFDAIIFSAADDTTYAVSQTSRLGLNQGWKAAEFNVVGNCCSTQAAFNIGASMVVRTSIHDGTANAPSCVAATGSTGETNNLTLSGPCTASGGEAPAIAFAQRFVGPAARLGAVSVVSYHNQQHFAYTASNGELWDAFSCPDCDDAPWLLQKLNVDGATAAPRAVAAPTAALYAAADQQHVAFLAANGEIWDVFHCPDCGGGWLSQKINLGGMTSGPAAITAPAVAEFTGHKQQHFAYEAAGGAIWDAYYCPDCSGAKWKLQKINIDGKTKAPAAASQPVLSTYAAHDQQHVVYLAANGEIWDAFFCASCDGGQWKSQKINVDGVTRGPRALAAPAVGVYTQADQQHFAYLAANGEIWDAFWCPKCGSGQWKLQRINSGGVTGGPAAASAPFVGEFVVGAPARGGHNQLHFAYAADSGDIWDAYYCPDCSGKPWKLQQISTGGVTGAPPGEKSVPPAVSVDAGHDQQHFTYVTPTGEVWDAWYCANCDGAKWRQQQIAAP